MPEELTKVTIAGNDIFDIKGTVELNDILNDAVWWVKKPEEESTEGKMVVTYYKISAEIAETAMRGNYETYQAVADYLDNLSSSEKVYVSRELVDKAPDDAIDAAVSEQDFGLLDAYNFDPEVPSSIVEEDDFSGVIIMVGKEVDERLTNGGPDILIHADPIDESSFPTFANYLDIYLIFGELVEFGGGSSPLAN